MARIQYIGNKPRKIDNVTSSGTVWEGPGDVREVPETIASALLKHPDVWRRVDAGVAGLSGVEKPPPRYVLVRPDGQSVVLDDKEDPELLSIAADMDLAPNNRTRGDALRKMIFDAVLQAQDEAERLAREEAERLAATNQTDN